MAKATPEQRAALEDHASEWTRSKNPWRYIIGIEILVALEKHPSRSVQQIVQEARHRAKREMDAAARDFADGFEDYWCNVWAEP